MPDIRACNPDTCAASCDSAAGCPPRAQDGLSVADMLRQAAVKATTWAENDPNYSGPVHAAAAALLIAKAKDWQDWLDIGWDDDECVNEHGGPELVAVARAYLGEA